MFVLERYYSEVEPNLFLIGVVAANFESLPTFLDKQRNLLIILGTQQVSILTNLPELCVRKTLSLTPSPLDRRNQMDVSSVNWFVPPSEWTVIFYLVILFVPSREPFPCLYIYHRSRTVKVVRLSSSMWMFFFMRESYYSLLYLGTFDLLFVTIHINTIHQHFSSTARSQTVAFDRQWNNKLFWNMAPESAIYNIPRWQVYSFSIHLLEQKDRPIPHPWPY